MKRASYNAKGFTLIELLIVIAIIAILALIAIPNFLEAQVRSKVSRAKADMRIVATAIESYTVDNNRAPIGWNEGLGAPYYLFTDYPDTDTRYKAYYFLTTPIAYITTIPEDPFMDKTGSYQPRSGTSDEPKKWVYYEYQYNDYPLSNSSADYKNAKARGYLWWLRCVGPSKIQEAPFQGPILGSGLATNIYDPSNGTMSKGFILRTNKGEYRGPNS